MTDDNFVLQPGDIIAIRGSSWISDSIIAAEYGQVQIIPYQAVSHVGLLIEGGSIPVVIEALSRVKTNALAITIANCRKAFIIRDKSLTLAQRQAIVNKALTFSADDYGYLDIIAQLIDCKFKTLWFTNHLSRLLNRYPICSYVVAAAYSVLNMMKFYTVNLVATAHSNAGFNFGVDSANCKPSDIMNYALKHSEIFDVHELTLTNNKVTIKRS